MSNNIDTIRSSVSETKNKIHEYENLSPEERMARARELETTISQIRKDLDSLKEDANQTNTQEIEQLEQEFNELQEQFNSKFKQELEDLQQDISENSNWSAVDTDDSEIIPSENDKPTWRERNKKTVLLWAWTLWVWLLIRRWWKKRKERKEAEAWWSTNSEKKEKKPWYKRWRWVGLIWVAWFFGAKWLLDYFSNKVEKTDDAVDQVNNYEKLSEEQKMKYEKFWLMTNSFYDEIWKKEVNRWYTDENYLWKISEDIKLKKWETPERLAWVVPFCIDKDSKNISKFLSESDINMYLFSKNYKELKNKVKALSKDKLELFLWPFATKLQSFEAFGFRPWKSLWENIQDRLNDDEEERQKELNFFFRQYTKVLTYTNDRKNALEYKIAAESIKARWYDWESRPTDKEEQLDMIKTALSDQERFEKEIKTNETYNSFLSSNLLWVWSILESNWLFNWNISDVLSNSVIWPLDEESDDILQYDESSNMTIIDKWIVEIDWWLSSWTKKDLIDTCNDLKDDMIDEFGTWFLQEYLERISYAGNMTESNKEVFLKETGLDKFADNYIKTMDGFREKIKNGTVTKEDLEQLKKVSSEYLAFKKELNLAIYTLTQIRDDNPDHLWRAINTGILLFNGLAKSISNIFWWKGAFGDYMSIVVNVAIVWWVIYLVKHPGKVAIWTVNVAWKWITWVAGRPSLSYFGLRQKIKWLGSMADKRSFFQHYLFNWKINNKKRILRIADDMMWIRANTIEDLLKHLWVPSDYVDQVRKYRRNKNLRKLMIRQNIADHARIKDKLFRRRSTKIFNFNIEALKKIKAVDDISNANPNFSKSINRLLKNMKTLDDLDKLKSLITDQKFLTKIEKLNFFQLKKISKAIGKTWFTVEWIDSIINGSSKIENIDINIQKQFNTIIDDAIKSTEQASDLSDNFATIRKTQLDNLKISNLTQTDMEALISLHQKGIKAQYLPDISSRVKVDLNLEKALMEWDFDEFSRVARANKSLKNVDNIIWEFDTVLKRTWRYADDFADIAKNILKVVSKIA